MCIKYSSMEKHRCLALYDDYNYVVKLLIIVNNYCHVMTHLLQDQIYYLALKVSIPILFNFALCHRQWTMNVHKNRQNPHLHSHTLYKHLGHKYTYVTANWVHSVSVKVHVYRISHWHAFHQLSMWAETGRHVGCSSFSLSRGLGYFMKIRGIQQHDSLPRGTHEKTPLN